MKAWISLRYTGFLVRILLLTRHQELGLSFWFRLSTIVQEGLETGDGASEQIELESCQATVSLEVPFENHATVLLIHLQRH